jgi:hypothetical protein
VRDPEGPVCKGGMSGGGNGRREAGARCSCCRWRMGQGEWTGSVPCCGFERTHAEQSACACLRRKLPALFIALVPCVELPWVRTPLIQSTGPGGLMLVIRG